MICNKSMPSYRFEYFLEQRSRMKYALIHDYSTRPDIGILKALVIYIIISLIGCSIRQLFGNLKSVSPSNKNIKWN